MKVLFGQLRHVVLNNKLTRGLEPTVPNVRYGGVGGPCPLHFGGLGSESHKLKLEQPDRQISTTFIFRQL